MKKFLPLLMAILGVFMVNAQEPADVKVLLETDFSVFTDGSEESPKSLYSSDFNKLASGYSLVSNVAAAGGKLLVKENGYLQLNSFSDIPSAGGTVRITARVFMIDYDGLIQYQPGYSSSEYVNEYIETGKWVDVVTLVSNVRSTSRIKIVPFLSISGFYIQSLKVEYSKDFIAAPVAYLPKDADGTQFTAECSVNSSAKSYEADVFSYDKDGNVVYFIQNVELKKLTAYSTTATGKVTGLDPETTYWYVARCVNAEGAKSPDSDAVKVVIKKTSIDAPVALEATELKENGFTANWEPVAGAVEYMVNVYATRELTQSEDVDVFAEDFSGVTIGSVESVEFSGDLNDFTHVGGWITDYNTRAYAPGYFVLALYAGNTGSFSTPEINLAASDGKFSVNLKASTRNYAGFAPSDDTLSLELLDADGNVLETAPAQTLNKNGFSDYTFEFTKGTQVSRIRVTFTQAEGSSMKLFIDEITVSQLLPAGAIVEKCISNVTTAETSLNVELTPEEGAKYSYSVIAVGETVSGSGASAEVVSLMSAESNRISVNLPSSGVENVEFDNAASAAWKTAAGTLAVAGRDILVADLAGNIIFRNVTPDAKTFTVSHKGIAIVLVDGKSFKIAL